jgi:hypothetical protein
VLLHSIEADTRLQYGRARSWVETFATLDCLSFVCSQDHDTIADCICRARRKG